jgi:hypothetical protein
MAELKTWRELVGGKTDDVILAIDFDATGRPEARFTDLAERLGPSFTIWETLPAQVGATDGEGYIKQWADEVRSTGRHVRAVLGFCAGAAFAPSMSARIGTWQETPPLILFDPEIVTPITLYWQYVKVVELAATSLTPGELDEARETGRLAQQLVSNLDQLAAELLKTFQKFAGIAFERMGLNAEKSAELMDTFAGFVGYLAAAGQLEPIPDWRTATVLASTSPTSGLNGLRAIDPTLGDDVAAREIRFELEHAELLRDDQVIKTVRELLA